MDSFEFSRDRKLWSNRTLLPWNTMAVVHHKLMWSFMLVWNRSKMLCDHRSAEDQVPPTSGKRKNNLSAKFLFKMWSGRDMSWFTVSDTDTFSVTPNFLFQLLTPEVMTSQANESLKYSEKPRLSSVLCGWWQNQPASIVTVTTTHALNWEFSALKILCFTYASVKCNDFVRNTAFFYFPPPPPSGQKANKEQTTPSCTHQQTS